MSARTSGVAVAVNAAIGGRGPVGRPAGRGGRSQPAVVRAEIVPPLGNAVRLVDDKRATVTPRGAQELVGGKSFGRHKRSRNSPAARPSTRRAGAAESIECSARTDAAAIELVDLVLHQRDQRRHHQRGSAKHDRGQLVAERFARPGRHHPASTSRPLRTAPTICSCPGLKGGRGRNVSWKGEKGEGGSHVETRIHISLSCDPRPLNDDDAIVAAEALALLLETAVLITTGRRIPTSLSSSPCVCDRFSASGLFHPSL